MSNITLNANAGGTGIFTIASPNSNTNRTLSLPDQTGTFLTNAGPFTASSSASNGAVTVDASGNVGIGTGSPSTLLNTTGTVTSNVPTGGVSGLVMSVNGTATGFLGSSATGTTLDSRGATFLSFQTNGSERARIDSSGNLLVAKTTTADTTVGAAMLSSGRVTSSMASSTSSDSTLHVYSTGASAYRFYVNMAGTVFATSTTITGISDQRLKENIRDLDDGLAAVMALKPRKFDWKQGKGKDIKDDRGFIAQEFEQVFPDLIDEWKDPAPEGEEPYKSVRADLIPTLVKAIQEQQALITALTTRIAALEAR